MAKLRLQAFYTLGELAKLSGISRWRLAKALESNGVEIRRSGNRRVVYLVELRRRLPDLWEGVLDRLALLH